MNNSIPTSPQEEEQKLRDALKRCSVETIDAAIQFRSTNDAALVNTIVLGILARFLEPEHRAKLYGKNDDLRLMEDLAVDSLTMVEVVMLVEEVLCIKVENEDLRDLRTLGDIKAYVKAIATGQPPPAKPTVVGIAEIVETMPHQPPFLFIQEAILRTGEARSTYRISGQEFFIEGHFKNRPVFPASLQIEALGQLGVLLLLKNAASGLNAKVDPEKIYFTSCTGVRCTRTCTPGDVLALTVRLKRLHHPAATFEGSITVNGEKTAFVEEFTLAFDYLPAEAAPEPATEAAAAPAPAASEPAATPATAAP